MEFMSEKIQFILDSSSVERYSKEFIQVIKEMLEPNPDRRVTLEETHEKLVQLASRQERQVYCIRLEADPNPNALKVIEPPKRKIMLSGITGKLMPKPISMISSTSTSRPRTPPRGLGGQHTNSP